MEQVIELVRREPCLYDMNHRDYCKKALKDSLWSEIAKETNHQDGPTVKDAWQKLRNCHRDAIRRRTKVYKSSSPALSRPWKYEKNMEFLVPHMANGRPPIENTLIESTIQEYDFIQTDDLSSYPKLELELEVIAQQNDPLLMEVATHILPSLPDNPLPEISMPSSPLTFSPSPQMSPHIIDIQTSEEVDLNTLITRTFNNHEKIANERAEKRAFDRDNEDDLQQFFNTMYTITKKMPALSQHKLKRKIFNLVSDEEEHLLNLIPMPIAQPTPTTLTMPMTPPASDPATPMAPSTEWMSECVEQYNQ